MSRPVALFACWVLGPALVIGSGVSSHAPGKRPTWDMKTRRPAPARANGWFMELGITGANPTETPTNGLDPSPQRRPTGPGTESAGKTVELPGLAIDLRKGCVDIESTVCLDRGLLELIACTKGSKEHESIVAIGASPLHIHTALLLLGAKSGNPAIRRPLDAEKTRWVDIPPGGDPVDVYLLVEDPEGRIVERPIGDFICRSGNGSGEELETGEDEDEADEEFPSTFLFAGSQLVGEGPGPRRYLSGLSGNVISIATFGDEVLCLPGIHGNDDRSLMWEINSRELPEVGSRVTLRLRPRIHTDSTHSKTETTVTPCSRD